MRDLTAEEILLVVGGDGEGGSGSPIIVTAPGGNFPPGQPTYPPSSPGGGGGTPTPSPNSSPAAKLIAGYTKVVIGHHNVYVPADLSSLSADEQKAVQAFEDQIRTIDSKIGALQDNATISIREKWTDSSGAPHDVTYTETGSDLKATWAKESFALSKDSDYNSYATGSGTNQTSRGSASAGADPNQSGNNLTAFALDNAIVGYNKSNPTSGEAFLALHETSHMTYRGSQLNTDTGTKNYGDFHPGTSNYADENLANTMALSLEKYLNIPQGNFNSDAAMSGSGGYQAADLWSAPSSGVPV